MSDDSRYPIGKFVWPETVSGEERARAIESIQAAPARLRAAVAGLSEQQLDEPYREGGWTVRQVVHHVPESHMNSYIRFKLALTEAEPVIKPYDEAAWAQTPDVKSGIESSLTLLEALHERWAFLLKSMGEADWAKRFRHPEHGLVSLDKNLMLYAWHGEHHIGHVLALRERKGWPTGYSSSSPSFSVRV